MTTTYILAHTDRIVFGSSHGFMFIHPVTAQERHVEEGLCLAPTVVTPILHLAYPLSHPLLLPSCQLDSS